MSLQRQNIFVLHHLARNFSALLLCGMLVAACADSGGPSTPEEDKSPRYSALLERTEYGTAHITAEDWGSLGFGQGYATAQDRFCVMADQFLKVRSQRAQYFGPGKNDEHIDSDFAYLALEVMSKAESLFLQADDETQDLLSGYVRGINKYLEDTGVDNLPRDCAGKDWVQETDVTTIIAHGLDLSMGPSSRNFMIDIARAAPPESNVTASVEIAKPPPSNSVGSNAVALGKQRTVNGKGLLLANPHWPWEGERRFHEIHLTIPGDIDFAGMTLPGVPGGLAGFTDSVAWAHTSSISKQFIVYALELVEGAPTRYRFGDEVRDMDAVTHTIEVLQPDGSSSEQSRTLYKSHYGPMMDVGRFGLAWSDSRAVSIFDANAISAYSAFKERARSQSVDDLRRAFLKGAGQAGVNVIATDRHGEVFYADTTLVPMLGDSAEEEFRTAVESEEFSFTKLLFDNGIVFLDGSDPNFSVVLDDRAVVPGTIPSAEAPQLVGREDYVANSNDSYWLSNPQEPLTGYSVRYGKEKTPRTHRTRVGLKQLAELEFWDRGSLKELLFANRSHTAELWREPFVAYCLQFNEAVSSSGEVVNIADACQALSNWDGRLNLDSIGAMINRELMSKGNLVGYFAGRSYYAEPFDPLNPIETPRGLNEEGKEYLMGQLADAVLRLNSVGIPMDAPLGDYQYTLDGGQRFSLHGGRSAADGVFNVVGYAVRDDFWNSTLLPRIPRPPLVNRPTGLSDEGYLYNFGSSFIMVVEFTDDGPVADAILTYSQSDDPDSPHRNDQMALYSSKSWRSLPYTREQIEADPFLTSMRVTD